MKFLHHDNNEYLNFFESLKFSLNISDRQVKINDQEGKQIASVDIENSTNKDKSTKRAILKAIRMALFATEEKIVKE